MDWPGSSLGVGAVGRMKDGSLAIDKITALLSIYDLIRSAKSGMQPLHRACNDAALDPSTSLPNSENLDLLVPLGGQTMESELR